MVSEGSGATATANPDDTPESRPECGSEPLLFVTAVYRWEGRTFLLMLAHHFLAVTSQNHLLLEMRSISEKSSSFLPQLENQKDPTPCLG